MKRFKFHILVALVLALLASTGFHVRLRDAVLDMRFNLIQRPTSGQIALIEIDARSIDWFGVWPWPRTLHAQLIDTLEKAGVTDIAFDVDFSSPSTPEADEALASALRSAGGSVILAAFRQRAANRIGGATTHINRPIPPFASSAWPGLVNVSPDMDGVIRRYNYGDVIAGAFIPSMGALLAGKHDQSGRPFLIDFGITTASVPTVSFVDIVKGDPGALAAIAGKKVIISGTAIELGDRFNVPNSRIIPGSMVQLLGAESILQGRALSVTSTLLAVMSSALLVLIMLLMGVRTRVRTRVLCVAVFAVIAEGAAIVIQSRTPFAFDTSLILVAAATYAVVICFEELNLRGVLRSIAERRYQHIAIALGDGLVCTNCQGRIILWNPAASLIFGYDSSEAIGRNFETLISDCSETGEALDFARLTALARQGHDSGSAIMELTGVRKSGDHFDLECSLSRWEAADGLQYGAVLRDISERKKQQQRIRYLAEFDTLTSLPNRNSLITRLERDMRHDAVQPSAGALLLIGIANFDQINDLYGHSFGDQMLVVIAAQLTKLAEAGNCVARLGNDEFALFIPAADQSSALVIGQKLLDAFLHEEMTINGQQCRLSISIGIAQTSDALSAEELLGSAHFALSAARASSQSEPVCYMSEMRAAVEKRSALETELRLALANAEFELFYQPQVDLLTGDLIGAEALIRWCHPQQGYISPGAFLPVVNTTTLSKSVADWILQTACRQGALWQNSGHRVRIGVNMAQSQFTSGDLVADIERLLGETGLEPGLLELEVTEDIVLDRVEQTQTMLAAIRALGVHTAYDDFGTGYGSLTYLKTFPLDKIKIDQTFVRGIRQGGDDAAIVTSTVMLSRALGLSVIAEGVEDRLTADLLLAIGCRQGQGYFFGRPMPASEFESRFLHIDAGAQLSA